MSVSAPVFADDMVEIFVDDLHARIQQPNAIFILDVRNDEEFEAWRIESKHTPETLHLPYFEFLEDEEGASAKVPADREILVVCAKGGASDYVADVLRAQGVRAVNLAGGMIDWGDLHVIRPVVENDSYQIYQMDRVARGCVSHILISDGQAAIIDPLRNVDEYTDFLAEKGATLALLLDTHAHADHISGGPALSASTGAPYYLHPYDGIHPFDMLPAKLDYEMLRDGQRFQLGELGIEVIHTPGHTLGQVNFLATAEDGTAFCFSGDNLFIESFGRPDLGGQGERWAPIVYETIFEITKRRVPGHALVLPGHYASPDEANAAGIFAKPLDALFQENVHLQHNERADFINFVLSHLPKMPEQYIEIKRVNGGLSHPTLDEADELELGKNICALSGV